MRILGWDIACRIYFGASATAQLRSTPENKLPYKEQKQVAKRQRPSDNDQKAPLKISLPQRTTGLHCRTAWGACLTVATQLECLPLAVRGTATTANCVVEAVTLANTTALLASACETATFTVLVDSVDNPVDPGIAANRLVVRVNANNLKVLVNTILVHPVRVQNAKVRYLAAHALFGKSAQRALWLELVHTLVNWLTVGSALRSMLLTVTTAHTHTVDNVALLRLVTKTARLVWTRWTRCTVNHIQLTVLPATRHKQVSIPPLHNVVRKMYVPDAQQEAEYIALLLLVQLFKVLVGTHLDSS